jgi:L-alanine-DL-glutamate epimerase-like enolase superfamily enzyme
MIQKNASSSADAVIRAIEAIPVEIPLTRPVKWARGQINTIDNVIVVLTLANGVQGIADAPPRPTIYGETQQSLHAIITRHLAPALIGMNAFDVQAVWSVFNRIAWNPAAKAAIDMALYDAQAKMLGISCAELMGGTLRPLPVNWRVSLGTVKETLADAESMMKQYGFRALKVKCGVDTKRDIELLRALRKQVGDDVEITVDMNQGYSAQQLIDAAAAFEEINIALIEEPIPARDSAGKLLAARRLRIPISGDDSCFSLEDVRDQLTLGAIRSIVIKCARTGYTMSRDIVALARAYHCPVHNGTQADVHIGSAAAGHFACSYAAEHAHEMSSFLDAADHVGDRDLVVEDGLLKLPEGPGIGFCLDQKKLARYRRDK